MDAKSFSLNPPPGSNLPIITHFVSAYKLWREFLPNLAKDARYTIGYKIDRLFLDVIELIFTASYMPKQQKLPYLQKAAARLDLLKFFLQISWEVKVLDNKKYATISEKLLEIGKMLGGWVRQMTPKETPAPEDRRAG